MTRLNSWVESANSAETDFPLNNLPYGVFSTNRLEARCGVAIGDMILDLRAVEEEKLLGLEAGPFFDAPSWNKVMAAGRAFWQALRAQLMSVLSPDAKEQAALAPHLLPMDEARMHMPFDVAEYTDFYAGRQHATNVGTMFRGAENALPPNWLHIPIGYNGRASSVFVSGTEIRRPWGQLKGPNDAAPRFAPCARFDIELEMGAIVGTPSSGPITVAEADANIFGYVLLNDWSARDIQAWEYQPLGPFQAKATATSISPWIVTADALAPFRCETPSRDVELLAHLKDQGPMLFDIDLSVTLAPEGKAASTIARTNYDEMYYSAAQQLAHHTTSGCAMRTGDLLGSGTISGPEKANFGSLLELSWGGKEPFTLETGETRSFIEDGDTLGLHGAAQGDGYKIGFGSCMGKVLPALSDPYARD
ncbi:MAG: fumarylacetoacetase [Pseudomonadota bacterium]